MGGCAVCCALLALAGLTVNANLTVTADDTEIVVDAGACGTTRFAAEELRDLAGAMLGGEIPIVTAPGGRKVAILLGTNAWSEAAGLSSASLERDEFRIRADAAARRIYIVGRDAGDQGRKVREGEYSRIRGEMATLFGVYDFLERFGGARFYFPGEFGTILPKAVRWEIPETTDLDVKPAFFVRNIYFNGDGRWVDGSGVKKLESPETRARSSAKALDWCRLRLESFNIPSCHGQNGFEYQRRFAGTHPEYFALLPDHADGGKLRRDTDPMRKLEYHPSQLCQSSDVWNEFYEDILAQRRGLKPSARGLTKWGSNFSDRYIDIMPTDGMPECRCDACQKAYPPGKRDPKGFATPLVWGQVSNLVSRLNAQGVEATYTMMAYSCYSAVPDFSLPSNILVQVAVGGPWNRYLGDRMAEEKDFIRRWSEKLGAKVRVWTYPGKYARYQAPCVPQMTPHAYAAFWQDLAPHVTGGFVESESDRAIYNYLNYYVFSRLAWDPSVDVEGLLDEHYRLMFGKAASEMEAFYEALERKWLKEVCVVPEQAGTAKDPYRRVPDSLKMATEVYSPRVLSGWAASFDRAEAAVRDDPDALRRVRFVRREFLEPMARHFSDYLASLDVRRGLERWRAADRSRNLTPLERFTFRACAEPTRDAAQSVTGEPSIRVSSRDAMRWAGAQFDFAKNGVTLKPNTRYRISYFLKYENVVPVNSDAGVAVNVDYKFRYGWMNPNIPFIGSHDWMYQEFVIDTAARPTHRSRLNLQLIGATGTAWFDGFRMEEVVP